MKWKCKAVVKFTFGFVLEKEYCSEHKMAFKKKAIEPPIFFFFLPFYSFPVSLEAYDISSALGPLQDPLKGKKVLRLLLSLLLGSYASKLQMFVSWKCQNFSTAKNMSLACRWILAILKIQPRNKSEVSPLPLKYYCPMRRWCFLINITP